MAQSFWSKRKSTLNTAGGYIKAADAVSRPTALLMTVLGIVVVGGLLFGIFSGTRWAYNKLANKSDDTSINEDISSNTTDGPSITATSSTSTTTPSTTQPTSSTPTPTATVTPTAPVVASTTPTSSIPRTGASSNLVLFISISVLSYLIYRKKLLRTNQS